MKRFITLIMLLSIGLSFALSLEIAVDPNGWQRDSRGKNQPLIMEPGVPELPFYPAKVLIPFGMKVQDVQIELLDLEEIRSNVQINHVRQPQPTSMPVADNTLPDQAIYGRDGLWPEQDYNYLGTQFYRGYQLAIINIFPWRYNPIRKTVYAAKSVRIEIDTEFDNDLASYQANFHTPVLERQTLGQTEILNSSQSHSYHSYSTYRNHSPHSRLIDLSTPRQMIIITDDTRAPWFADYVSWRNAKGISTAVFLTSDIYSTYTGTDNAAKIRAFITDAYQSWADSSTPLEYVILGGDDEVVPERGCKGRVGGTVDNRMPTDIYFSNLDGTWNANNNTTYGENNDQVDYLPEVHIGRFPAETIGEFNNMFRKHIYYTDNNTYSNNLSLLIGENLNMNPVTWGGDYKDDVALHIPDTYQFSRLYQREGTYNGTNVWNAINSGYNVMNHMGHANETSLIGQATNTIHGLQNSEYGFLFSQGCYPAAFDQRTSGDGESIGEHFVIAPNALMAFIGNTRYGWYAPGSIDGASQYYDRSYFVGMFENAQAELGKALTYSRLDNLNSAMENDVMRWCYYETVLFGDPSITVKHPDTFMPLVSLHSYTVTDEDGDNDGTINPGESIRIYPRFQNHEDWHTAFNVTATIQNLPTGVTPLTSTLSFASLAPGQITPEDIYFSIQLPLDAGFGTYDLELVLDAQHPQTNQSVGIRRATLSYDITLLDSNFPWDCNFSSKSAPVVYDFDNDESLDILFMDVFGNGYMIDSEGDTFDQFATPNELNINRSFAMDDLDQDGAKDLVLASREGSLVAMSTDGTIIFNYQTNTQLLLTPVTGDLDGDGSADVVVAGLDRNLYALDNLGNPKTGFPILLSGGVQTELAVADLDGDGSQEIIVGTSDGILQVINGSGTSFHPSFPLQLSGAVKGAPVILDNSRIAIGTQNRFYLISPEGNIIFENNISEDVANGAVLADLNRNGSLDIIFVTASGNLYALDQNGNSFPGFPMALSNYFTCPPLIADLDSDGLYEIILNDYNNSTYIVNNDGTMLSGYPFPMHYSGATPATLVDFNGNGFFKLVAGYANGVVVVNLRRPVTQMTPWITYRGSLTRQGSYAATGYVANQDINSPALANMLRQNYPNPFNPQTTISYQLEKEGPLSLRIYNLKGQLVRNLFSGAQQKGSHSLIWNGKDDSGSSVGSGIYFYRLESTGFSQTKKMLLAK